MPDTTDTSLGRALLDEAIVRMNDESLPRVLKCLDRLSVDQVWARPNPSSNSVGNLVLHLCGNIRQHIIHGLGGEADDRQRDTEFEERGPIPVEELAEKFSLTLEHARGVLDAFDESLLQTVRCVQGMDHSCLSIVVHVVEHLSYHTGQISYITKMHNDEQLGYYDDVDLNVTGGD